MFQCVEMYVLFRNHKTETVFFSSWDAARSAATLAMRIHKALYVCLTNRITGEIYEYGTDE